MKAIPATQSDAPFLTIPPNWRQALIVYLVLYHIFFPIIPAMMDPNAAELLLPRFLLNAMHVLLICWPLFFYRREYGFLHPLILPTLLAVFEDVAKFPLHLIDPIDVPLIDFGVPTTSIAMSLRMSISDLAAMRLWYQTVQILALICYYVGYFQFRIFKVPSLKLRAPRNLSAVSGAAALFCIGIAFAYMEISGGGISSHLVAMRSGRAALFQGQGQFLAIGEFSMMVVLVWFVYLRKPFSNPIWLGTLIAAGFTTLVVGGSRSRLIYALAVLLLLWWKREKRVLVLPTATMGILVVAGFAIFGSIRQDWNSHTIDTSVFSISRTFANLERAQVEFAKRQDEEGDLAAFAGASNGLLWGRTYLEAVSFWIPRAFWHNKPHGAGAYNMWVNFAGRPISQFGTDTFWGIPVTPVTEAYWNFHLPGVAIIFILFGAFHRWLSGFVWRYPNSPVVLVFSTWVLTHFIGDSATFVNVARDTLLLGVLCYALGILRSNKRGSVRSEMRPLGRLPVGNPKRAIAAANLNTKSAES